MRVCLITLVAASILPAKPPLFLEKGGIVAMEAESTNSRLGSWIKKTDVKDFQGTCHLEFTGNTITNGPPKSPLTYRFKIQTPGRYRLTIRARKRLETERKDLSNDCFVALKGDFTSGGNAPLALLKKDTKMFGGHATRWDWTNQLDPGHNKPKVEPLYELKAGEEYELTVSGRSKNFNIDRILFIHESKNLQKIRSNNPPESKSGTQSPDLPKKVTRTLTDKKGRTLVAQLQRLAGETLHVRIKGRASEISLDTLSKEDQEFIRAWAVNQSESPRK